MNQAPTRIKSRQEVNRYINKVGLMNQTPTRWELGPGPILIKGGLDESSPYKYYFFMRVEASGKTSIAFKTTGSLFR